MSEQDQDYDVGYGKPPKSGQFKKGQSGNPKGRPKGAKGLKASLKRELESSITVRERGREVKLSKAEVLAKGLMGDALKGDAKARTEVLRLDDEFFGENPASGPQLVRMAEPEEIDLAIVRDFLLDQKDGGDDDGA
ncbi:MAG: DUF5681 domain-containing protein [Pseudomonadota bacterium]